MDSTVLQRIPCCKGRGCRRQWVKEIPRTKLRIEPRKGNTRGGGGVLRYVRDGEVQMRPNSYNQKESHRAKTGPKKVLRPECSLKKVLFISIKNS